MKRLDRAMWSWSLGKWIGVLTIGTFLILLGQFMAKLGDYLRVLGSTQWWLLPYYFLLRLPDFLAIWLPLATLVAAMFVIAPQHRQGTLVALSAAGIAPRRMFRVLVALAMAACVLSFVVTDQIQPRLAPLEEQVESALVGKRALGTDRTRAASWSSGDTYWSARHAFPQAGVFEAVAGFQRGTSHRMVMAGALRWNNGWILEDVVLVEGDRAVRLPSATPASLHLALVQDRAVLAEQLRPDAARTSSDLLASNHPRAGRVLAGRIATACLPLLCLLWGLPRFLPWADRTRPAVTAMKAIGWALIPLAATAILGRLLVAAGAQPILLTTGVLGAILTGGILRWRAMRL